MRVWKVHQEGNRLLFKPDSRLDTKTEYRPSKEFEISNNCFIGEGIEEQPIRMVADLTNG